MKIAILLISFVASILALKPCYGQESIEEFVHKAIEHASQGKFQEAKEELQRAGKLDQFNREVNLNLKVIENVLTQRENKDAAILLFNGILLCSNKEWDKGMTTLDKAIEINPNFGDAYLNRGLCKAGKGGYDQAISDFSKAIEINHHFALAYYNRGVIYAQGKAQYDQAIIDYSKAMEIDPNDPLVFNNRGLAYQAKNEHDRAISDFNKAIQINPKYAKAYNNRGLSYIQGKRMNAPAISDFSKAISIDPNIGSAYKNRAIVYYYEKAYDKAWDDVRKAQTLGAQIHPGFIEALRKASGSGR